MVLTLEDYLPIIIAALLAFIGSFVVLIVGRQVNAFDKTKQQSTLSTINIVNVQEDLTELKHLHKDLKDFIEKKADKHEVENREEFRRVFERIDRMNTEVYNLGWRVRELESHYRERSNGSGGAVM